MKPPKQGWHSLIHKSCVDVLGKYYEAHGFPKQMHKHWALKQDTRAMSLAERE